MAGSEGVSKTPNPCIERATIDWLVAAKSQVGLDNLQQPVRLPLQCAQDSCTGCVVDKPGNCPPRFASPTIS